MTTAVTFIKKPYFLHANKVYSRAPIEIRIYPDSLNKKGGIYYRFLGDSLEGNRDVSRESSEVFETKEDLLKSL